MGNAHPWFVPHDVYRCAGDDRWVAVVVRDDGQWARLAPRLGLPAMTRAERARQRAAIDEALSRFTRAREADAVACELIALGVEASPVRNALDLAGDPHVAARGFVETIDHASLGPLPYPGPPWRLESVPTGPHVPAPCLGEHTEPILRELGYASEAIAALRDEGALR
jgi:benzylsuccinate CoA-transferase BbsF subunit